MRLGVGNRLFSSLLAFVLWGLVAPFSAQPQNMLDKAKKEGSGPMVINSQTLEFNEKDKVVTFTGDVTAEREDFTLSCDQMIVYYEDLSKDGGKEIQENRIKKIVAQGNVRINRAKGGMAKGEKAVYYQDEEKVVLTGNPLAKRGEDFVEGSRITIFLKENRSVVESSGETKVRAVIHSEKK